MKQSLLGLALFFSLIPARLGWAQTFEVGGPSSAQPSQADKKGKKAQSGDASSGASMGWGSSIEVGRNARAAQDALKKGDYAAALTFSQRMTQAAPNDARNWFLLGYCGRLAGRFQTSLDAYRRGLARQPNSVEGLSGMAQTYMRMGKADEAKRLLMQVIAANPRRPVDLTLAGELFLQSGDVAQATSLLERSEAVQPAPHTDLILAIAYMKGKQEEKAKQLLDRAIKRSPGSTDVFRAVAEFYRESRDYQSAIAILQRVPTKGPDVLSEMGYTYELAGMKKESADTYEKAAGAAPKAATIQLAAAQAELRVGNVDKTRAFLARAEQIDASHYRLHATRGDLAMLEHRDSDAVQEYQAALSAMPEGPQEGVLYPTQLRLDLIRAYRNLDDKDGVQQQLQLARAALAPIQVDGTRRVEYLCLRAAIQALGDDMAGAEADLKEALATDPASDKATLQYASLLWKMQRKEEAKQAYLALLSRDGKNRYALEAMGYLSRDLGDNAAAEQYFTRMASVYPDDYVPYMALGDLYTSTRVFDQAQANYEKANSLAPGNAQIIVGGSNAAIDAQQVDLAGAWVARASGSLKNDPRIMREMERYLFLKGRYAESARLGEQAVTKLPHDRDAAVYLAYDLYNLGRYDEVLTLVSRYETVLPKEPNFPLLAGHVHRQDQLLQQAIDDFSRALEKDPHMVEALVNRGYARNDMQDALGAIRDFQPALQVNPDNGVAHLGLAFSFLQVHRSRESLEETNIAEKLLGESGPTHMARAGAYRQMRVLNRAETEYRLALKFSPDDLKLHEALADTLYHARHYNPAIQAWEDALQLSPDDPLVYASLAACHAQLGHRAETLRYIQLAEDQATDQSAILLASGEALLTLGDHNAAMERFTRALEAPDANRVDVRLALAKLFAREGKFGHAKQEVALAFAESRIGEASPLTTDNLVEAANVFLAAHDFPLAERYFSKAKDMGASDETAAIGLADTYLAEGKDRQAAKILAALGKTPDYQQNYDFQLAWGNVYNQEHQNLLAISAFARANQIASEDRTAQKAMLQVAGQEGTPVLPGLSMRSELTTGPVYQDTTVYEMDDKLLGTPVQPITSQETALGTEFNYRRRWVPIRGYFGLRNFHGDLSLTNVVGIIPRNTFDTLFNVGVVPSLRLAGAHITLNPGVEFTIRRDTVSPVELDQNLLREYLYLQTSPFGQWLAVQGYAIREAGPYTRQPLRSRDLAADLEFRMGRPWGHTFLVTGYYVRDILYHPQPAEFFSTAGWGGVEHQFGQKVTLTVLGKYLRAWRVQDVTFTTGQILVPGARVEVKPWEHWTFSAAFDMSHGEGFQLYNNYQTGFLVSYVKPLRRIVGDGGESLSVDYPMSFSFGIQQQSFYNYNGAAKKSFFRPVIKISLF
ncbi:MAG TPA: tetratricopeptide repeat protein [Candidatus Angelobacter sp.]|nr:tetratricopeptide repeat protein [Candidatus Angelobacter sp.]